MSERSDRDATPAILQRTFLPGGAGPIHTDGGRSKTPSAIYRELRMTGFGPDEAGNLTPESERHSPGRERLDSARSARRYVTDRRGREPAALVLVARPSDGLYPPRSLSRPLSAGAESRPRKEHEMTDGRSSLAGDKQAAPGDERPAEPDDRIPIARSPWVRDCGCDCACLGGRGSRSQRASQAVQSEPETSAGAGRHQ
jgi:hypothetical protein